MRERISEPIAFGSSPGAIDFISRRIMPRFCMSARTAAFTPGYCTLTATSRPSSRRARYTWPIEAAAIGTGSKVSKTSSSFSPYSCSMTFFMSLKETFGAASRSSASLAWNCSRYSGGTRPTSRNDITCPSFMAAPFIVPSAATICSAVSTWRRAGVEDRQHADDGVADADRRGGEGVGLVAGLDGDVVREARVALEVLDRERRAGLHDVAGDALVGAEARAE